MPPTKIFLSCVSTEFRSYRLKLANHLGALKGRPYEIKVQEDFDQGGFTLLDKLAGYIRSCDLLLHLAGDACGARPTPEHVHAMFAHLGIPASHPLPDRSYTQWEYDLAQMFSRETLCFFATPAAPRDCPTPIAQTPEEAQLQHEHIERIKLSGKHREKFTSHADLINRVFYDLGLQSEHKINNLPYKSLGSLFKGREEFLAQLRATLGTAEHLGHQRVAAITATATAATVYGLGGIGKTRAALEYAHRYAHEYTALLFVQADSAASLQQNLASLCGPLVLDLAEKDARETEVQLAAVLQWLTQHPGWFLILDNVDSEEAAKATQEIIARLTRAGQVVITSRLSQWEGAVETLALDVLTVDAASDFLLERTAGGANNQGGRRKQPDDTAQSRALAVELGQLALALEQASAYIVRYRSTFVSYMEDWRKNHARVLAWFDERTMQYPRSVAITWQTSFARLTEPARHLLRLLSFLAPDPIPESLLTSGGGPFAPLPAEDADDDPNQPISTLPDPRDALAELTDHSLAKHSDEEPTFSIHRLVQDVTRRTLPEGELLPCLKQALQWMDDVFVGDPTDVRTWPVLEPLMPHAHAIAGFADQQQVPVPTARLMMQVALLFEKKSQFAEAEPLSRRALAVDEKSNGPDHPEVATDLNNLAALLKATNRSEEAEPLQRRALAINERFYGPNHPEVATNLSNLAQLFQETNRLVEAEHLMCRALAIDERFYGPDHPTVAFRLNNLAQLLHDTNRLVEAEPLMRRTLTIFENAYGANHPNMASALNNLARLLGDTNRSEEAEPLMRGALAIDETSYGRDHPQVAVRLNNLALLLQQANRLAEAEPLMRRALAINEASYGPDHPNIARNLNNLARLLLATNRLTEAEPLIRRDLIIFLNFTRAAGHLHPNLQDAVNYYASLLQAMGRSMDQIRFALHEIAPEFIPLEDGIVEILARSANGR